MIRALLSLLVVSSTGWGAVCQLTGNGTYASIASTTGLWTGGCPTVPGAGDTMRLTASGGVLVVHAASGESYDFGSKTAAVGDAIILNATSTTVYSQFIIDAGATIRARAFDGTANRSVYGDRYSRFYIFGNFQPDAALGAEFKNEFRGILHFDVGGKTSSPPDSRVWSNTSTYTFSAANSTPSNPAQCDEADGVHIACWALGDFTPSDTHWVSNAAGTGPTSGADTSLVFTSVTCSSCGGALLTTPKASKDALTAPGDYYVNGVGRFWMYVTSATGTFEAVANWKYGNWPRVWFDQYGVANSHNEMWANGHTFEYLGPVMASGQFSFLTWRYNSRTAGAGGNNEHPQATNNTFRYITRPLGCQRGCLGTSGDRFLVTGNTFEHIMDSSASDGALVLFDSARNTDYLTLSNNIMDNSRAAFARTVAQTSSGHQGWVVEYNIVRANNFFYNAAPSGTFPSMLMRYNAVWAYGYQSDTHCFRDPAGDSTGQSLVEGNLIITPHRTGKTKGYTKWLNNYTWASPHHGWSTQTSVSGAKYLGIEFTGNICSSFRPGASDCINLAYNTTQQNDGSIVRNTTSDNMAGWATLSFSDSFDNNQTANLTNLYWHSNMGTNGVYGYRRRRVNTYANDRESVYGLVVGYTNMFGNSGADYRYYDGASTHITSPVPRFANFTGQTNITGVSPNFPTTASGTATMVYTYNSFTDRTLTWDSGTPVPIVMGSGISTGGTATTLTHSPTPGWTTDKTLDSTPAGRWLYFVDGPQTGNYVMVCSNTTTILTFCGSLSPAPTSGNSYVLFAAERNLAGLGSTITVGIMPASLPATTKTDSAVSWVETSRSVNPYYVANTRNWQTWDASLGGTGTGTSAFNRLKANPSLTTTLMEYLRNGFMPMNQSLWVTGYQGSYIGAVDPRKLAIGSGAAASVIF